MYVDDDGKYLFVSFCRFFFFFLVSLITICLEPLRKLKLTNHTKLKICESPFFVFVIYIYMYRNFLYLIIIIIIITIMMMMMMMMMMIIIIIIVFIYKI